MQPESASAPFAKVFYRRTQMKTTLEYINPQIGGQACQTVKRRLQSVQCVSPVHRKRRGRPIIKTVDLRRAQIRIARPPSDQLQRAIHLLATETGIWQALDAYPHVHALWLNQAL
jgi:hypothetical protein